MGRDYREYEPYEKVLYATEHYWRCGFYESISKDNMWHYVIGVDYTIHNDLILPYNEHTKQYIGEDVTGEETETP